jgi:hypothetical protein
MLHPGNCSGLVKLLKRSAAVEKLPEGLSAQHPDRHPVFPNFNVLLLLHGSSRIALMTGIRQSLAPKAPRLFMPN